MGLGFSPALVGAGFIIGINVAISILIGVGIGWVIGVPVISLIKGMPEAMTHADAAHQLWSEHVRYLGVGAMLVGGVWTLLRLLAPMAKGLQSAFASVRLARTQGYDSIPRTERDMPIHYVLVVALMCCVPLYYLFYHFVGEQGLSFTTNLLITLSVFAVIYTFFAGFIFTSLCGYFAGLVGSTNNPVSAMSLAALIIVSLLMVGLFSNGIEFTALHSDTMGMVAIAIIIGTIIASASAIGSDTIQDLKTGHLVGATPWKQQVMLILGASVSAMVIPPILQLLFEAYGIGGVFPREGMDP